MPRNTIFCLTNILWEHNKSMNAKLINKILSDEYPLGTLLERELEKEIRQAICHLPDVCRKVFLKSRFEGKKYEEIAAELAISVNTVKYHIKTALTLLHKELDKYLLGLILLFFISS